MATTGNITVAITEWDSLKFTWTANSQSVANNSTTVGWKLELIATGYGRINSTISKDYTITVNGTKYTGTNKIAIGNNETKTLVSGTTDIAHNADGSKTFSYSFTQEIGVSFSGKFIDTKSGSGSGTLNAIPRAATLSNAPNFNDEENPTITYSNPAGNAVASLRACISDSTGNTQYVAYRDISKTGTSYTFTLTDAERQTLRNATKNSNTLAVRFYIQTNIGGTNYYSRLAKTFTITNAAPTMNPTAVDNGTVSKTLTGDSNKIIKGYNSITVNANAAAVKGATLSSYSITNGGKSIATASGTLSNVETGTFTFKVTDSRGNITTKTVSKTLINYVKLTCNLVAAAPTTAGEMAFTIKGNYFNGSFGAVANALTVQYRYKTNSGSYGSWTNATATLSGNAYTANVSITGLDYLNSYTFEARAGDKIYNGNTEPYIVSAAKTVKTTPVFDWGENDFKFNVPVYEATGLCLSGAAKALSNAYTLATEFIPATGYSEFSGVNAVLLGNTLRCHFSATRSTATGTGNIANETIGTIKIKHSGKIKSSYRVNFSTGATGTLATFQTNNEQNDGIYLTMDVQIMAVHSADTAFTSYFNMPCVLNLDKY